MVHIFKYEKYGGMGGGEVVQLRSFLAAAEINHLNIISKFELKKQ